MPTTAEPPRHLIRFLRDCYEADNREAAFFDLRHERVRHFHMVDHGSDFLLGTLDLIPLNRELAIDIQKSARLYETERTLIFCAFMLVGTLQNPAPPLPRELFAPLIFFPAAIDDQDPRAFLRVDARERRINTRMLAALIGENACSDGYLDEILGRIPQAPFATHQLQSIIGAFEEFLPGVDARELVHFPRPFTGLQPGKSRASASERQPSIRCLPACAVALVPNSPDTRGVLAELAQVASARSWPPPLRVLTGGAAAPPPKRRRPSNRRVPASLSSAQLRALQSAATEPLSLIIGPPGTGKSFTAAAIAVDHVLRGQSVVIAAKTPQALDVLSSKLEGLLGDRHLILRGGRGYMRDLTNSLGLWLEGGVEPIDIQLVQRLRKEMASQAKALARLEGALRRRAEWELQWGKDTAGRLQPGVLRRFARRYRIRITDWRLARQGDYWDLIEQYQQQLRAHHETIGKFVRASVRQQRQKTLHTHRREMVTLLKALRARTNRKQEEWFSRMDLSLLLRTFPVWLTPLADVGGLLPLKRELFDLAIMDEATQCDMAGCLPVFYRARRAIITGDPRQLRHLSFLSRERQRQLAGKWSLSERESDTCDYRQRSILDWVAESIPSQEQVVSLDEHFRSRPQIIAFSNREFYRNRLRVMTRRPDTLAAPGLSLRVVNGHRERNGPNRHEADQVVVEVVRHVESEKDLPANLAHSLGVLSPFREQVDFLYSRLSKTLSLKAIQKHRLRIGTAHSFQGEERDIMFLSFVADPQTHPAALRYLERPDVFNVSITRARSLQMIFSSIRPSDLPSGSLLRKYLESIDECPPITAEAVIDAFQEEVQTAMVSHGWQTWPGYVVAGVPVDLLIAKNARSLGIDLVGYPGHFAEAFDLEKYRLFERAGLRLFPLSFSAWRKAPQACIEAIERWLSAVCHTQWLPP